ncbi:MAG TPA: hypothetical protein VG122_05100, partial [Gemmata sp.]|nr:hypothetical protein [Gemmata sp.]
MGSLEFAIEWLTRAAAGGCVILVLATMAVRLCRQPADRVRVTGLALVGALLVPWLAFVPGLPRCSLGVLPPEPVVAAEATSEP